MDKLLRDVFVNVIANIVAIAILYLLATGAGALPQNSNLQLIASTSVVGLVGGLAVSYWVRRIGKQRLAFVALRIPSGAYVALRTTVFRANTWPWWYVLPNALVGGVLVATGVWLALRYDQHGRHTRSRSIST